MQTVMYARGPLINAKYSSIIFFGKEGVGVNSISVAIDPVETDCLSLTTLPNSVQRSTRARFRPIDLD